MAKEFKFVDERFADIGMLRYELVGFEELSLRQKKLIYYLSEATLYGRDITFDQFGKYNLLVRWSLENIYENFKGQRDSKDFRSMEIYLKRVWFSNGIYHHYGGEKFSPEFSKEFFVNALKSLDIKLPSSFGFKDMDEMIDEILPIIFEKDVLPLKVNRCPNQDLVKTSACNFYQGLTQKEVEEFYSSLKDKNSPKPPSYGLNSTLVKEDGKIFEIPWCIGSKYSSAIEKIVYYLNKALEEVENENQREVILSLIKYYTTGSLEDFNSYCIKWVKDTSSLIDFINGFIEVYDDPLALKGTWEALVEYRDEKATRRTRLISDNAQWFEDNSPIDERFKKKKVSGVSASVISAAMLGGGEYPSTAIGINLPNADWIRARYGSKSISISNIIAAYNAASKGNGFLEEFVVDTETIELIKKYGDIVDALHTDLHECLGHGSGQLLPKVDADALKEYGNTIEEARADLFGLYYAADKKMLSLGLLSSQEAYKAEYYSFIMNGLLTQLSRIKKGNSIQEAHMRDRALIARWCFKKGRKDGVIELIRRGDKTFVKIGDYEKLRGLFAELLIEIQRIKSEGDYSAAKEMVETYAVKIDEKLHEEILERYNSLNIPPYKGFINPILSLVKDSKGDIIDVKVDYGESYSAQMIRYSKQYATLI